jgi:hypothetical protein
MLNDPEAVERLIRMEAKLDSHLYRTTQAEHRLDGLELRTRHLETATAKTLGIAAGASTVVTVVATYFHNLLGIR